MKMSLENPKVRSTQDYSNLLNLYNVVEGGGTIQKLNL